MKVKTTFDQNVRTTVQTRYGQYYVAATKHGNVVKKWPKKRVDHDTPAMRYKRAEFGTAARWASDPDPVELLSAIEAAKGVPMAPRDFLTMAAYGTNVEWSFEDGTPWVRYRDVTINAQLVLDQVTDTVGALIWRAEIGWIEIAPGSAGQILQTNGAAPSWQNVIPPPTPYDAGSGTPTLPYWADANQYLVPPVVGGTNNATFVVTANRIYFIPLIVPYNRTFTSIAIRIPTGGSVVGSSVRLGLYLLDPVKGGPGTVVVDAGTVTTATTGLRSITISQPLARGVYFAALWTSAAISVVGLIQTFSLASCGFALGAAAPASSNYLIRTDTFGSAFADQTANTQTTNVSGTAIPIVGIR